MGSSSQAVTVKQYQLQQYSPAGPLPGVPPALFRQSAVTVSGPPGQELYEHFDDGSPEDWTEEESALIDTDASPADSRELCR